MPLVRKSQIALETEAVPGTAATLAGADVVDTLSSSFSQTQELIDRQPAGGSLSKGVEAVGRGSAEIGFEVDIKGSGTATTEPNYWKAILAALYESVDVFEVNLVSLSEDLEPGDRISENGGDAEAVVVAHVSASGSPVAIPVVPIVGTWTTATAVDSALKGASIGTTGATPISASATGLAAKPISDTETEFTTTADWSVATPPAGMGVVIRDGATVVGEAFFLSDVSTTVKRVEMIWGVLAAGYTATSETSGGATTVVTLHATPAISTPVGAALTVQLNRDRLRRRVIGGRTTFSGTAEAGQPGRFSFTVSGQTSDPVDEARLTASGLPTTTPPRFASGYIAIDGIRVPVKSFEFDAGAEVIQRADANRPNGEAGGMVTGRDPSLRITVEQTTVIGLDYWTKWTAGTTVRLGVQVGATTGNIVSFVAEAGQIAELSDGEVDGIATFDISFRLRAATLVGDDEVYLAHV